MSHPIRVAINGYGRIGRCVLRALYERGLNDQFTIVAINEPADLESMAHLTRFDSTHGAFHAQVDQDGTHLIINGQRIVVSHARTPEGVDWSALELDLLIECSGAYGSRVQLQAFIDAGCPRVLLSHPGNSAQDVDATVVLGINEACLNGHQQLVSNASCTTNAIVPILAQLEQHYGVASCFLTTLHSVMNDQPMIDGYHHTDLRRTRSAMQSMLPVSTGLAAGVERLLPYLKGKVQAKAIRVPILNVSAIDMQLSLRRSITVAEINACFKALAHDRPSIIAYTDQPHASVDFNHNPHSAIVDASQTRVDALGNANVFVWFDNEWGFANRLIAIAQVWAPRFLAASQFS